MSVDDTWDDEAARGLLRAHTGGHEAAAGHVAELARRRAALVALVESVAVLFSAYGYHATRKAHHDDADVWAFEPPRQPALFVIVTAAGRLTAAHDLLAHHKSLPLDGELLYDRARDRWYGPEVGGRDLRFPGPPPRFENPVETVTRAILHAGGWR